MAKLLLIPSSIIIFSCRHRQPDLMNRDNNPLERYSRQILFSAIGREGQEKLSNRYAVIAGCGALGSIIADSLARAGVGRIRIIDRDFLEEGNLQRQVLFDEEDVRNDLPKAIAAQRRLQRINSAIEIDAVVSDIDHTNVEALTNGADVILDGLDNFETRFLLNDCCVKNNTPWIYGACVGSMGLTMNIIPHKTPCLRCIFESLPPPGTSPTCDTAGIIAPIAHIIASIEVAEAIKILTDNLEAINKKLIRIDVWKAQYDKINVEGAMATSNCPVCKKGEYEFLTAKTGHSVTTLCGRNAIQIKYKDINRVNLHAVSKRLCELNEVSDVTYNDFVMKCKLQGFEITLFGDGRAIILGTSDPVDAKNIYAKYIGM